MSSGSSVQAFGITARLPKGWEARVTRLAPTKPSPRAVHQAGPLISEVTQPYFHFANFPLPPRRGAFGTGAVERMKATNALLVLFEYSSQSVGTALFAPRGLPRTLRPTQFNPKALQRILPGQAGYQAFFTEAGRAFSVYAVLGSQRAAASLVPQINQVLGGISISENAT